MSFNFIHNQISSPSGNAPTWEDWLKKQGYLKEASEAKPGLGMDTSDEPRGQMRGQVINNDNEDGANSYQEGESVDGKKEQGGNARKDKGGETDQSTEKQTDKEAATSKQAKCGKEMGESSDAGKVTEKHTEAAPGDDESDVKTLINNDPNYQKGESVKMKKKETKASSLNLRKIASLSADEKIELFAKMMSMTNKQGSPAYPLAYIEAMLNIKVSNLSAEIKSKLEDYFLTIYPAEFVKEMLKDR